jgi:hypothetical protein
MPRCKLRRHAVVPPEAEMTANQTAPAPPAATELTLLTERLYQDGIIGLPRAFTRDWVRQLGEDVNTAFAEARARPDGAVGRGPHRYYVEIHPEQLHGFVELASHPWITAVADAVLGPEYRIVEVGFDVPLAGAVAPSTPKRTWARSRSRPAPTGTTAAPSTTACSRRARPTRATANSRRVGTRAWATFRSARR